MANSYWFKHDDNARNDEKIQTLIFEIGYEGYGIYWALIEEIIKNDGYMQTYYARIAHTLRTDKKKVKRIVEDFGLFEIKNNQFTSERALKELKDRKSKIKQAKKAANARWNSESNADADADAKQEQCGSNADSNAYIDKDIDKDIDKEKKKGDKSPDFPNESILDDETFYNLPTKQTKKIANRINEDQFDLSKSFTQYQKNQFPELVKNDSIKKHLKGADTVRLLQEQDDFTFEQVKNALKWGLEDDDFWADKILSLAAIRKKSKNGNKKFVNLYKAYRKETRNSTQSQYERLKDELE